MGQKELCARSLKALIEIQENANEIKSRCDEMKSLFSDVKNFPLVEYLESFTVKLEKLKKGIVSINGPLLTIHTEAITQKQIANRGE